MIRSLAAAIVDARREIWVIAAIYVASVTAGALLVHRGNHFALAYRDSLVDRAHRSDPAALADDAGAHARAAAIDFARNLGLGAVPDTVGGLLLVTPVGLAAYRGWVGGIVSVDGRHHSRLGHPRSAFYFLVTLLLQLSAFTLAGGAGLKIGWAYFRGRGPFVGPRWFRLPAPALATAARLYVLVIGLFALGSYWEFLGPLA